MAGAGRSADRQGQRDPAVVASLPFAQYDTVRKESAKQLGLRVTTLDEIVGRLASRIMTGDDDDDTNKQGTRFEFAATEPWPDAVDGAVLTADMVKAIRNHVILGEHQALAVALWIIHTHALEAAEHTPRLQIKSPTMRCGKSTLLDSVAAMVPKGLATQNISTAALFRIIEMKEPTLLIDEADNFFKNSEGRDNPETLGILTRATDALVVGSSAPSAKTLSRDFQNFLSCRIRMVDEARRERRGSA